MEHGWNTGGTFVKYDFEDQKRGGARFALTPTLGKLANIASEVGEIDRVAEGFLKSFTAGDMMTFDRKHVAPIEALPTARLILSTNNRPRFSDRSGGLWRRMICCPSIGRSRRMNESSAWTSQRGGKHRVS